MKHKGYTIAELAIVIGVISVLMVLVVVTLNGMKVRANKALVKVDLAYNVKKLSLNIINTGRLPGGTELAGTEYKVRLSKRSKL